RDDLVTGVQTCALPIWRQDNRTKRLEQARTTSRGEATLTKPRIDAPILDQAPTADKLTDYDRLHLITYIRLLDADTDGIPWEEEIGRASGRERVEVRGE